MYMNNDAPQLKIRLPEKLKKQITSFAKENKRSINAEIVDLLEGALNSNDSSNLSGNAAINRVISLVANRANKLVERELTLNSLTQSERELLTKLDALPKQKRELMIDILISLLKIV